MTNKLKSIALTGLIWLTTCVFQPLVAAEIQPENTSLTRYESGLTLTLGLSEAMPFRVYTLDNPRRLLVDLGEVDVSNVPANLATYAPEVEAVRAGLFQIDESRIVLDLNIPLVVKSALSVQGPDGAHLIEIKLARASAAQFVQHASNERQSLWRPEQLAASVYGAAGLPLIAIDAGHGGVDFGAEQGEVQEKDIVLEMAHVLRETLLRDGKFRVILTRETDVFVPLGERVEIARRAGAAAFISLHADTVTRGRARGTTVFSLSEADEDQQAVTIATLENRADLVAGISMQGEDDQITRVLLQMAHRETNALSNRFADVVAERLWFPNETDIKSRRMAAGFRVLRAPDIPSVLIELGFMSDKTDLENMQDPEWQRAMAEALRDSLNTWMVVEAEMRGLLRN